MNPGLLLLLGVALLAGGCAANPTPAPTTPPAPSAPAAAPVAAPTRVTIPALTVDGDLIATGLLPDGSPEVPSVHTPDQASWADWSPQPGEVGPATLLGHVNGEQGGRAGVPGVFARVHELRAGDEIRVARADGSTARFLVDRVETFPKTTLTGPGSPQTATVWGDTAGPELRLVTCGGDFDRAARSYEDQVVVFARLAP